MKKRLRLKPEWKFTLIYITAFILGIAFGKMI